MRHAAGGSRSALARDLLQQPDPVGLCNASAVVPASDRQVAHRQAAALRFLGIDLLPVWEFPPRLTRVAPLPLCLFVRGGRQVLCRPAVAIVGSRRACPQACRWAAAQAKEAVRGGFVVVSGGARGVDAAAHRATLEAGGQSVVFHGVSVDRVYPAEHRALFEQIVAAGGALVSEHPPGVRSFRWFHAARNRFIAAQAHSLWVAEAGEASGTLGTARWAHRLGVPIWVSPREVGGQRAGLDQLLEAGWAQVAPHGGGQPQQ